MEPAINLYSSNEKSELIRENSQEILSVLAAHQIALWEYDIITGKCSFSNDYFFTLGLKDAGIIFRQGEGEDGRILKEWEEIFVAGPCAVEEDVVAE